MDLQLLADERKQLQPSASQSPAAGVMSTAPASRHRPGAAKSIAQSQPSPPLAAGQSSSHRLPLFQPAIITTKALLARTHLLMAFLHWMGSHQLLLTIVAVMLGTASLAPAALRLLGMQTLFNHGVQPEVVDLH